MNYQDQTNSTPKTTGAPMYSSTWLALFELLRASLKQNPTV